MVDNIDTDVGNLDVAAHLRPVVHQVTDFQCCEGDGAVCVQHIASTCTGIGIKSTWNIDCEHRHTEHQWRLPGAPKPSSIRSINDEIGTMRVDHFIACNVCGDYLDRCSPVDEPSCRNFPVGSIAALSGNHHDSLAIGPTQHSKRSECDSRTCSLDKHVMTMLTKCGNLHLVGATHLGDGDDRNHAAKRTEELSRRLLQGSHYGNCDRIGVTDGHHPTRHPCLARKFFRTTFNVEHRRSRFSPVEPHIVEAKCTKSHTERLHRRFANSKSSG
jgi:hypothetical protein